MKPTSFKFLSFFIISLFSIFPFISCSDDKDDDGLKIKYFILSSEILELDIEASEGVIDVKTNLPGITVNVEDSWCKAVLNGTELKVKVEEFNGDADERNTNVTLKAGNETKTLKVTQSALSDQKIKIASATAEYSHSANGIEFSFDNDLDTYFMSHWTQTIFPFDVIYNFDDIKKIDFFIYQPRPGGEKKNGLLGKLEVWYATKENPGFTKYKDYDFETAPDVRKIEFIPALTNPTQIKFVLYKGYGTGTYAAIGEMEFYRAGKKK
ncbi:BACON domain-containing protein [Dysgonomonas reticulitermitis]